MIGFKHYYNSNELSSDSGGCSFRRFSSQPLDVEPEVDTRFIQFVEGTLEELLPEDFGNIREIPEYTLHADLGITNENITSMRVELPDTVTTICSNCFNYSNVIELVMPPDVYTIGDNVMTNGVLDNTVVDFSKANNVPVITENSFDSDSIQIKVPESLYPIWIISDNWADISSKIVAV